jgi:hypothetical protein
MVINHLALIILARTAAPVSPAATLTDSPANALPPGRAPPAADREIAIPALAKTVAYAT